MCVIYAILIALAPLFTFHFRRPDLVAILDILGMSLILPIQILVCHDKALEFFMERNPNVKMIVSKVKDTFNNIMAPQQMEDEESTSEVGDGVDQDQVPNPFPQPDGINTVSGRLDRVHGVQQEIKNDDEIPEPYEMWKLRRNNIRNHPMAGRGPIWINVKSAPNAD